MGAALGIAQGVMGIVGSAISAGKSKGGDDAKGADNNGGGGDKKASKADKENAAQQVLQQADSVFRGAGSIQAIQDKANQLSQAIDQSGVDNADQLKQYIQQCAQYFTQCMQSGTVPAPLQGGAQAGAPAAPGQAPGAPAAPTDPQLAGAATSPLARYLAAV